MSDDERPRDDLIDLATVHPLHVPAAPRLRVINDKPATVTELRSVRRGRARQRCEHRHSIVDYPSRVCECADCGAALDPIAVLHELSRCPQWLHDVREERERIASKMGDLRAEHDALRAKVATAKREARKHDCETRISYEREALDLLRIRARSGHIDATYTAHLTSAVLKGQSLTLADQMAGNAQRLAEQHAKRSKKLG